MLLLIINYLSYVVVVVVVVYSYSVYSCFVLCHVLYVLCGPQEE